jgi:hypothetical protein
VEEWKKYYATQSIVTEPGKFKELYDGLPDDIPSLCKIIQGVILHMHWTQAYGQNPSDERKTEVKVRQADRYLERILELQEAPLNEARPAGKKIMGTCRDYAAMLTSILRHKGVPARMRVGFATYFTPGHYEDHYLCQYWNEVESRWVMVDAQLDELQRNALKISFDPCDVPEGLFLPGGKAWQICREDKADPDLFGIFNIKGMWFIGCDMIFDAMSLNKIESHPWDIWPMMPKYQQINFSEEYLSIMDHIAELTGGLDPGFAEVRLLYQIEKKLQPPPGWKP